MDWAQVFVVMAVSHLFGDFVLQTDWQAVHKHAGLAPGNAVGRAALLGHGLSYTLAFVPCFVWLAGGHGWSTALIVAAITIPHVLQDDGRLLAHYMRRVKGCDPKTFPTVALGLDQTLHLTALLLLAIAIGGPG